MIHLLAEYCRQQKLVAEPSFSPKFVRWAICCDDSGQYTGLVELGEVGAKKNNGQEFPCCPFLSQGELIAGGVSRSHFLADYASVALLLSKDADDGKLKAKHEFFRQLVQDASSSVPLLLPAARLLYDAAALEAIRADCARHKVKPTDRVTRSEEHT